MNRFNRLLPSKRAEGNMLTHIKVSRLSSEDLLDKRCEGLLSINLCGLRQWSGHSQPCVLGLNSEFIKSSIIGPSGRLLFCRHHLETCCWITWSRLHQYWTVFLAYIDSSNCVTLSVCTLASVQGLASTMIWTTLPVISSLLLRLCAAKTPLSINENYEAFNPQIAQITCVNNDVESLANLPTACFTTLRHPLYPEHSVRIKKTAFCDETVQYAPPFFTIGSPLKTLQSLYRIHRHLANPPSVFLLLREQVRPR